MVVTAPPKRGTSQKGPVAIGYGRKSPATKAVSPAKGLRTVIKEGPGVWILAGGWKQGSLEGHRVLLGFTRNFEKALLRNPRRESKKQPPALGRPKHKKEPNGTGRHKNDAHTPPRSPRHWQKENAAG